MRTAREAIAQGFGDFALIVSRSGGRLAAIEIRDPAMISPPNLIEDPVDHGALASAEAPRVAGMIG